MRPYFSVHALCVGKFCLLCISDFNIYARLVATVLQPTLTTVEVVLTEGCCILCSFASMIGSIFAVLALYIHYVMIYSFWVWILLLSRHFLPPSFFAPRVGLL